MPKAPSRLSALALAVLVTFLWSTSWVLIKFGLRSNLPPVTFAGLRYSLAFLCLAPVVLLNRSARRELFTLSSADWGKLALLGILTYTITQAAQYLALAFLPAAMLSLLLNMTSLFVALAGIYALKEVPSPLQWVGIFLTILGAGAYFLPVALKAAQWMGIFFALICLSGNAGISLFARQINRQGIHSALLVTFVSMGLGSILMLGIGVITQGIGALTARDWVIIAWLAFVNTALTFTIWNHTLRTLSAMESSIVNSLMMPQIAILAYVFLRESLSVKEIIGLILVGVGVVIAQLRRSRADDRSGVPSERPVQIRRESDLPH
ncbi:MAG: DMT family transporter [Bacteroidota bacterium]